MTKVFPFQLPLISFSLFLSSCVSPPEQWEDTPRLPRSRTLPKAPAKAQVHPDPWIQAQRLMEQGEPRPQLVGVHALKNWLTGQNVHVWDLSSERARASFGRIEGSRPIDSLQQAKKESRRLKGTLVLVADESQEAFQKSIWKELRRQPSLRVVILSGGIEGWARIFPKNP
jgi:hypothetical protein